MYRKIKRTQSDIHTCGVLIKIYNSTNYSLIQRICADADRDHDDRDLEIVT